MSLRRALFTEADIRRARKAAPDCTVEITMDGTIRIVPGRRLMESGDRAPTLEQQGHECAKRGMAILGAFWGDLTPAEKKAVGGADQINSWKRAAADADAYMPEPPLVRKREVRF